MAIRFDVDALKSLPGKIPTVDGEINDYLNPEVKRPQMMKTIVFINGMANTGVDHKESALALSLVQMSRVTGVYNKTSGFRQDLIQCLGDKNQFNGFSLSAAHRIVWDHGVTLGQKIDVMRRSLSRNPAQVSLFDLLRRVSGPCEVFAHSQGNLILSNVLQALDAIGGSQTLRTMRVYSFGSPALNWPAGVKRVEMAYTLDPVSWLGGIDLSFSVSKLGMPSGSWNPVTHAFLQYLNDDPAFVINRFRTGGWGVTFNMDEDGLAQCLAEMGDNTDRVFDILSYLKRNNPTDSDDIALAYTGLAQKDKKLEQVVRGDGRLKSLLIELMSAGYTGTDEKAAIAYLRAL